MKAPVAVGAALATVIACGGVAVAVSESHRDLVATLPPVCRDNPGSAGGSLPNGPAIDKALGRSGGGSSGAAKALTQGGSSLLGKGSGTELKGRAQALLGGTAGTATVPGSGTGAGGDGQSGGLAGGGSGGGSGSTGSGSGSGTGGGDSAGTGNGGGAGGGGDGTGGGTGGSTATGPGSGSGVSQVPGPGSDALGVPQQVTPALPPPKVDPPQVTPPSSPRHVSSALLGLLLALLALAALVLAGRLLSHRERRDSALPDATGLTAREADARAAAAMAAADHDAALRWTFVAGLLRLDDLGVLAYDPARTTRECARRLRSARFRDLARGFDLVAYGGRHATAADVAGARASWQALLTEVAPSAPAGAAAVRLPVSA